MTLTRSFIRDAAMTPLDARLMNMAELVANSDGSPRVGVLGGANASIVSTTGTMNVAIAAAEFATSKGKADGSPIFTNDGVVNVAIAGAPVSNSRIDVIYVKHSDNTTGDGNALPAFGVLAGVAAASPTKPGPLPTGALELATLRVYSGTTATNGGTNLLTNTYQMTTMRGGIVPFRNTTERDAWTTPCDGQLAWCFDVDALFEWVADAIGGAAWIHVGGKPLATAPSYVSIYSAGAPVPRLIEQAGQFRLEGIVTSTGASFGSGTYFDFGTIPAAKAPVATRNYPVLVQGVFGSVQVTAAGALRFFMSTTTPAGTILSLSLDGISWPDKRLA